LNVCIILAPLFDVGEILNFFAGINRKDEFILLPYNMSVLYVKDTRSVSARCADELAAVTVMSCFSVETGQLCCRKYKVTATSTNSSFISQHTSAIPNTIKLLFPYLETKENELTAECSVY
jgi:hypothetical protein